MESLCIMELSGVHGSMDSHTSFSFFHLPHLSFERCVKCISSVKVDCALMRCT